MFPEYAEVNERKYKINTDFRVALRCNEIAQDKTIGDTERALAIIYTLFGVEALKNTSDCPKLMELAVKYLKCGIDDTKTSDTQKEPDIDYKQDENYIRSSFKYDYGYDPYKMEYLHWWEFWNDLNNLSSSEFGACCILSRVRQIRNLDTSKIKDLNERKKMIELKKQFALKKNKKDATEKEKNSARKFYEEFYKK